MNLLRCGIYPIRTATVKLMILHLCPIVNLDVKPKLLLMNVAVSMFTCNITSKLIVSSGHGNLYHLYTLKRFEENGSKIVFKINTQIIVLD